MKIRERKSTSNRARAKARVRRARKDPKRKGEGGGRGETKGGRGRISRAAIAGRVIERKRNYGVRDAAASRGSRVITHRRRAAIVPAT